MTTERDRAVDTLRAIAILGVVLGHWLVTALVVDGGAIRVASPLRAIPSLAPASWLFQTLALFFFVGGLVAARSSIDRYGPWLRRRLTRLFRPVLAFLAAWAALLTVVGAWHIATPGSTGPLSAITSRTVLKLVASPLWFLVVFAALTAATPLVRRLHPGWPLVVVAAVDAARFGLGAPQWLGWVNLAAGWLVPFCLGAAWSRGRFRSRAAGWSLLGFGITATLALTHWFGYPVSMVGVPGEGLSNLNPPTLAAVTFGIAQCGAALLLLPALRRAMRGRRAWPVVAVVNLSAMTIFLWHQTSLIAVTLLPGRALPGLGTAPDGASWLAGRMLWLPVFATALLVCWLAFHRIERPGLSLLALRQHLAPSAAAPQSAPAPLSAAALLSAPAPQSAPAAPSAAASASGTPYARMSVHERRARVGDPG